MIKLITWLIPIISQLRQITQKLNLKKLTYKLGNIQTSLYVKRENLKIERLLGVKVKDLNKLILNESESYIKTLNNIYK